jgi:hypothetical protein
MNHYRYHTCCPPEAAFIAADMLGIYMEPQLPFWGTITEEGEENGMIECHLMLQDKIVVKTGGAPIRSTT